PPPVVWPILQIVLLATLAAGSCLFLLLVLHYPTKAAFIGALFNVSLFYWFHENDMVTSAVLLLPLIGFLSIEGGISSQLIRAAGVIAIITVSNPPATLLIMPVVHFMVICFVDSTNRQRHVINWAVFWALYGVYFSPTLWEYLTHLPVSSRSLFGGGVRPYSPFMTLLADALTNRVAVVSPAVVLLALIAKGMWRITLLALAGIFALAAFRALEGYLLSMPAVASHQWVFSLSTLFYRAYYFIGVVIFVWGAALIRARHDHTGAVAYLRSAAGVFLIAWIASRALGPIHSGQFRDYALLIGLGAIVLYLV